jgi:hypothetical protein
MGYRVPGSPHEQHESTGTTDWNEAKQKLREKLGEIARGRVTAKSIQPRTLQEALDKLREKRSDIPAGHLEAWGHALGTFRLNRVHSLYDEADQVLMSWKKAGVDWPDRPAGRVRPIRGSTGNRYLNTL